MLNGCLKSRNISAPKPAHLIQLCLLRHHVSLSGVCLGAKISPEDGEKTNAQSSCPPSRDGLTVTIARGLKQDCKPTEQVRRQSWRSGSLLLRLVAFTVLRSWHTGAGLPETGHSVWLGY